MAGGGSGAIRAFVAIRPPEEIVDRLMDLQTDLRDVHWTPADNLHLTLVFLGAHPGPVLSDVDAALLEIDTPAFELSLAGVGALGGRDARVVYAGVRENGTLRQLHAKAAQAARQAEIALDRKRFRPHVTLGRAARGGMSAVALERWLNEHALFEAEPFLVDRVGLYRSELGSGPPRYELLAEYELSERRG